MLDPTVNNERPAQELTGRTAVVTGASGGIGRAIAVELAQAGAAVVVHGHRNRAGADQTAAKITEQGGDALVVLADLAQPADRQALLEQAYGWRGEIDVWMNNAGVDVLTGRLASATFQEKLQALWEVDVAATIALSQEVGRKMLATPQAVAKPDTQEPSQDGVASGSEAHSFTRTASVLPSGPDRTIINIGWDQAEQGMAGESGELFGAIKGAVMAFTRSLAQSLAPQVRVNCLAPGWIRTAWAEQASDYWQQRACSESLMARWGNPQDVARAARFLAGPQACFLTGQILPVNGGFRYGYHRADEASSSGEPKPPGAS